MRSPNGTILDATALIDFCWLGEWGWLKRHYSPLYIAQEVLDSDRLQPATLRQARENLMPLTLNTEAMFGSFIEFGLEVPLLSEADRSTLAIARHQLLVCASDDGLVVETCQAYGIAYIRTLRLLSEMVATQHKTAKEVVAMACALIEERGKRIAPKVLNDWKAGLR